MIKLDPANPPKLAHLIAQEEGFYKPGSIPARYHNPGDLRHSPHSFHSTAAPDAIGQIPDDLEGWEDLERQLNLYAQRGMTTYAKDWVYPPIPLLPQP